MKHKKICGQIGLTLLVTSFYCSFLFTMFEDVEILSKVLLSHMLFFGVLAFASFFNYAVSPPEKKEKKMDQIFEITTRHFVCEITVNDEMVITETGLRFIDFQGKTVKEFFDWLDLNFDDYETRQISID